MSRTRELLEKKKTAGGAATVVQPTVSRTQQLLAKKGISTGVDRTAPANRNSVNEPTVKTPAAAVPTVVDNSEKVWAHRAAGLGGAQSRTARPAPASGKTEDVASVEVNPAPTEAVVYTPEI